MSPHDAPHPSDVPPAAPPPPEGPRETGMTDRIDLGAYLNRAWELFTANAGLLVGGFAILFIILVVSAITVIGPLILAGPLMAGYYGMIQRLRDGRETEFGELFAGFRDFARTCVAGLLVVLVLVIAAAASMIVGFILGHIPCLGQILAFAIGLAVSVVAGAASMFIIPAIVVTAKAPVEALGDNVRFAQRFVTPALLLAAVHVALGMVGSLVCLVGLLVTMPVASAFVMEAYHSYYRPRAGA